MKKYRRQEIQGSKYVTRTGTQKIRASTMLAWRSLGNNKMRLRHVLQWRIVYQVIWKEIVTGSKLQAGPIRERTHANTHTAWCHKRTCSSFSEGKVAKISLVVKVTACAHSPETTVRFRAETSIFPSPSLCPDGKMILNWILNKSVGQAWAVLK